MLQPRAIVVLGRYAQKRALAVLGERAPVHDLLHPSPANPLANQRWPELAEEVLGPWLPQGAAVEQVKPSSAPA